MEEKKRILFVDDEPMILDGLRRMLRKQRTVWDMSFVTSGAKALEKMKAHPVDVVVTDMHMPGMDGAEFLAEVRRRYPDVIRIMLSGYVKPEVTQRAMPVAHQFLSKPCEAEALVVAVNRICRLRDQMEDRALREIVAQLDRLPSLPSLYIEVNQAIASPDASLQTIGRIVSRDIAMSTKLLRLVNSAFFMLRRRIVSVEEAVVYLGTETLKNLVLTLHIFSQFPAGVSIEGFSMPHLTRHSLTTAGIARAITLTETEERHQAEEASTAGMLHDIGRLILATNLPDVYVHVYRRAREEAQPMHEVEMEVLGVSHAQIGAYLLGVWGLPPAVVEAVAEHHALERVTSHGFSATIAVHVADILAHQLHPTAIPPPELRQDCLESLGVANRVARWREIVHRPPEALLGNWSCRPDQRRTKGESG